MNIDYVIVSTDENPLYSDFWEVVKPVWNNKINIKPILVNITNNNKVEEYEDCIIHNIKSIDGINTGFQSQIARMYITKFYSDKVCLTSDIDMIPINKEYFKDTVNEYKNSDLVIYSSDAYKKNNRYPICYNSSLGSTFCDILNLNEYSFEEYCKMLLDRKQGWDTDELYFGECVNNYTGANKIVKLNRGLNLSVNRRIDRSNWTYDLEKLHEGFYIDSHSLRPYYIYKKEVDKLINNIL